ncbi:hypothetical protein AX17_006793 [Amanita inopinata Kibby_2008]|nr:hypothetical protein AX17_006793 [Amanita inopinata Kibby_2008]
MSLPSQHEPPPPPPIPDMDSDGYPYPYPRNSSIQPSQDANANTNAEAATGAGTPTLLRSPFFLVTLFLAICSWFISLISQAIVTAQISNVPIGTLWFATILQAALIPSLILSLASTPTPTPTPTSPSAPLAYSNTLSHIATITTVLASIGVNDNIYSRSPAESAVAAGWITTAIVDLLWIIYLSSPQDSLVRSVLTASSSGAARAGASRKTGKTEKTERGPFGFAAVQMMTLKQPQTKFKFGPSRLRTLKKTRPESSAGNDGAPLGEGGGQSVSEGVVSPGVTDSGAAPGSAGAGTGMGTGSASASQPRTSANVSDRLSGLGHGKRLKAEALYSYHGSDTDPNELSFAKGDKFEVLDQSKKWWEVVKENGKVGIIPSNYVRILEP